MSACVDDGRYEFKINVTGCDSQDVSSALMKEGLKYLEESANTLKLKKEDGTIVIVVVNINSIAHSYYSQILTELENLSASRKKTNSAC
eukprot:scaffold5570_cov87-Skeletonema_dohrnii-CCMP3373.AAC.10